MNEPGIGLIAALGMIACSWFKLGNEGAFLAHREEEETSPQERSARLLGGLLGSLWRLRRGLAFVGGLMLPVVWIAAIPPMIGELRLGVSALAIVVLGINLLGDALRQAYDPRFRGKEG